MFEPNEEWRLAAERTLSIHWDAPVSCEIASTLREKGRNRVFRLAVAGGPMESVILKVCVGDEHAPYVRGDPNPQPALLTGGVADVAAELDRRFRARWPDA